MRRFRRAFTIPLSLAAIAVVSRTALAAPTANNQNVSVAFNSTQTITLTGSDPNNLPLTYSLVTVPTHGSLTGIPPNLSYHPVTNYIGSDSFRFLVNNGQQNSNTATVSITVN